MESPSKSQSFSTSTLDQFPGSTSQSNQSSLDTASQPLGADVAIPQTVGRYQVRRLLGRGAFGAVYLADDPMLRRTVALKLPRRLVPGQITKDFLHEAQMAARLKHPNLVAIYDIGALPDGTTFIAMEHVNGESLRDRLTRGPLSREAAIRLLAQVAAAIHHAHQAGVIHRDLKPGNILIDAAGQVKVADFGLALPTEMSADAPAANSMSGTPAYMSPEQFSREKNAVTFRSDLWSLGVVAYECLAGRVPFRGSTISEIRQKILTEEAPPPPPGENRIGPDELTNVVTSCLSRDPARRPASAAAVEQVLLELVDQSLDETISVPAPAPRSLRRWWPAVVALLALAALGLRWLNPIAGGAGAVTSASSFTAAVAPQPDPVVQQAIEGPPALAPGKTVNLLTLKPEPLMFPAHLPDTRYVIPDPRGHLFVQNGFGPALFVWPVPQPPTFRWTTRITPGEDCLGFGLCWNLHSAPTDLPAPTAGYRMDAVVCRPMVGTSQWEVSLRSYELNGVLPHGVTIQSNVALETALIERVDQSDDSVTLTIAHGELQALSVFGQPVQFHHHLNRGEVLHRCRVGHLMLSGPSTVTDAHLNGD